MKVNLLEQYPLLTLVSGQTDGGEARAIEWRKDEARCLGKFLLPFEQNETGKWYPPELLSCFWTQARPELAGKALIEIINENAAFGLSSWGADLVLLGKNSEPLAALNYTSALHDQEVSEYIAGIDPAWWHEACNGAGQQAYQPLGILKYMANKLPPDIWPKVAAVVPVTDYLTYALTGVKGCDSIMSQSQGLSNVSKIEAFIKAPLPMGTLCPWESFDPDMVVKYNGLQCIPGSHDSVFARLVGFSGAPYVVWSGSWLGVAASIEGTNVIPCQQTRELGLSFEGLAPRAVQKNTGMFGPVFRELRKQSGMNYEQAASFVLQQPQLPALDCDKINSLGAPEAAGYVIEALKTSGKDSSPALALATVVQNTVQALWDDLQKVSKVVGKPLQEVAVVGGWANNSAFCELLSQKGVKVVKPLHAANATEVGLAANMLYRITKAAGQELSMADILPQIPELMN